MRSRDRLTFQSTLAYTLYLVFKRLKHKSLLRCKGIAQSCIFFPYGLGFRAVKVFLETARLLCV
jgi:hypothetical protein